MRSEPVPGHLPAPLTSFIGRDDELKLLAGLMDASRLVTIVGAGGAGKTRLAVEAMTGHHAYPRGRVWFAPLAGVSASEEVADAVLGALGPWEPSLPGAALRGSPRPLDRVMNLLTAGEVAPARELLPRVVAASFAGRDIAPAAELMAGLLLLEDDPAGAATALGLSRSIRGVVNEGDPELRALTAVLVGRLGGQEYDRAYRAGAELPRDAALRRLTT
ncbi:hypothetical protein ACFV1N_45420 [Streptosporangium canum]|uniref:hypothetical protein n=1 Tax=Streptosporangium canum TaxID=324952 RepID=UPI00367F36B2